MEQVRPNYVVYFVMKVNFVSQTLYFNIGYFEWNTFLLQQYVRVM